MTEYKHKENSGSIWPNDKKEKETHPDGRGSAVIDGVDYWISAWKNKATNGTPWSSLRFERKDSRPPPPGSQKQEQPDFDDDIPF